MPIEFDEKNQIISLKTKTTLYAMKILYNKFLIHLYYGKNSGNADLKYDSRYCSFSPYFEEYGLSYSPDTCMSEFSYFGSGDFRETALKIRNHNGDSTTLFTYRSHRIFPGRVPLDDLPYAETDELTSTVELTLTDDVSECTLKLYYTLFEDSDVISRYFILENHSDETVKIEKCMSLTLDLPSSDYDMISLYGSHYNERQFQRTPLFHGGQSICSRRGASSHQFNPFVAICSRNSTEENGNVYGFNFVYSGNFLDEIEVDQNNVTRIQVGLGSENFSCTLSKDRSFTSPEAVMTYSGAGIGQMSRNFHKFIRNHILPKPRFLSRPVVLNTWEACYFDINEKEMLRFAKEASSYGIDMLVIDDGWFGKRNNDMAGLGDWYVNLDKFKNGLKAFVDKVKAYKLKFGIWIEPEMVNPDSDLYRAHPEWCLQCKSRESTLSRNQLVLDLSNNQVIEYLKQSFSKTFDGIGIDYFKWDMNRHLSEVGSLNLPPDRQDEAAYLYMLGVYKLYRWFIEHFPNTMIESCSGGGGRYDIGMMKYSTQIWTSDNTYPISRMKIQYASGLAYPPSVMSCHVSNPKNVCDDERQMDFRYRVALGGVLGYELHLPNAGKAIKKTVKSQIEEYRRYEDLIINGDLYRLLNPFETHYCAYYFVNTDRSRILLTFLQDGAEKPQKLKLKISCADRAARYRDEKSGVIFSGEELINGITVLTSNKEYYAQMWYLVKDSNS
jgi:Alpha-galactosidase